MRPPCFVCEDSLQRPEQPWEWSAPRMLCPAHGRVLRLPDGRPLSDALERVSPPGEELQGSLLGWIFNPLQVEIAGGPTLRAWADFAAGGIGVLEDRFGAESYFEFCALNLARDVDALYAVHLAATVSAGPVAVEGGQVRNAAFVYSVLQRAASHGPQLPRRVNEGLSDLILRWNSQARLSEMRAAAGRPWPASPEELREWLLACSPLMEPDARALPGRTFMPALVALAARRFAGA